MTQNKEGEINPYQQAIAEFNALSEQDYKPESYLASIVNIQTSGFLTGVNPLALYETLEHMTVAAISRAETDPSAKTFSTMQKRYQAVISTLRPSPRPQTPPRPKSSVAAG